MDAMNWLELQDVVRRDMFQLQEHVAEAVSNCLIEIGATLLLEVAKYATSSPRWIIGAQDTVVDNESGWYMRVTEEYYPHAGRLDVYVAEADREAALRYMQAPGWSPPFWHVEDYCLRNNDLRAMLHQIYVWYEQNEAGENRKDGCEIHVHIYRAITDDMELPENVCISEVAREGHRLVLGC